MEELIMEAQAGKQQVQLFEDRILIRLQREAGVTFWTGKPKEKSIPLSRIGSVQFKPAGTLALGYISFVYRGMAPKSGLAQIANDENTVVFTKKQQPEFERLKSAVQDRIATLKDKQAPPSTKKPRSPASGDGVIMEAQGSNGKLQLLEDRIRIVRKGFKSLVLQGVKGDKDILLSQVSSVQFKRVGTIANGYIQFAFVGGQEAKAGIWQATSDENTVMFNQQQQPAFEELNSAIRERMGIAREGKERKASSNLDELEKLASLRDKRVITEDEFQQKKKQLLGL